jgi:hypothetical protein
MATATKTRAAKAAPAADAPAVSNVEAVKFQLDADTNVATGIAGQGWRLGVVEATVGHAVEIAGTMLEDKLLRAYFRYGYTATKALAEGDSRAIEAAKADNAGWEPQWRGKALANWPEFGPELLKFGRRIVDFGMSPKTKKLDKGKFRMTDAEAKWSAASTSAWHRVTETEADKVERKARQAEGAAKKKAEAEKAAKEAATNAVTKANGETVKITNSQEGARVALNMATAQALVYRNNALHMSPKLAEMANAMERAARENWEANYVDADGEL